MTRLRTDAPAFAALLASPLTRADRDAFAAACQRHFGDEHQADIAALLDLLLDHDIAAADTIHATGIDRLYRNALIALVESCPLENGVATPRPARRIQSIDQSFDFFFSVRDERDWSLLRFINFLYRRKIQPRQRVAIVTTIRNEGINLIEWIAHHRQLGIDDFIIYVNDNDDGSSELLKLLAEHGLIQLIWNTTDVGKDGTTNMFPIQAKCFGHASEFLLETRDFEWLLFLDPDEFLVTWPVLHAPLTPRPLDDLFARLATMPQQPAAVSFNWKWFKSVCEYARRPGLNFERFVFWGGDAHVKTLARGDRCVSFRTSHLPDLVPGDVVLNGGLEPVEQPDCLMPLDYRYGQINHYFNKSFEEYVAKHLRVWGDRTFAEFFTLGGNRDLGHEERLPAAWIQRVHAEIGAIQNLAGIAEASRQVEAGYAALLAAFDREHDIEALFYRHIAAL